jgi:hypothetical protein
LASGTPDADGRVELRLGLPEAGVVSVVQGYAVASDQQPPRAGDSVDERGERATPAGGFRVLLPSDGGQVAPSTPTPVGPGGVEPPTSAPPSPEAHDGPDRAAARAALRVAGRRASSPSSRSGWHA